MLTKRQQLTIEHLKNIEKIDAPQDIITWCKNKLTKTAYGIGSKKRNNLKRKGLPVIHKPRGETRKHSRKYYQGIIEHYGKL